jgi:pimeloyl-ACP methyl ester carboxylesterase
LKTPDTSDSERSITTAEGIRISYDDLGGGEPSLLLLPGWASSRKVFAPIAPELARTHRVLSPDLRGHGHSSAGAGDFGLSELVDDAVALIERSDAHSVIPVALSHAGWIAIELRKRLGDRLPGMVLLDWIILDAPPPFLGALAALQGEGSWRQVRDQLFSMWLAGAGNERLSAFLNEDMGSYEFAMWARAGREIEKAYRKNGSPLHALAALQPSMPVLHIYAQPDDPGYLDAQKSFAAEQEWFDVVKLQARTHFPMFETPADVVQAINAFVTTTQRRG